MKKLTIVVPTYWTYPSDEKNKEEEYIFDHPTPLDRKGTLGRLLFSLNNIDYDNFEVLVLSSAVHDELKGKVESKVELILKQNNYNYPIKHFSYSQLNELKEKLKEATPTEFLKEINLKNYGNIRNLQLLVPYMDGTDIVVAIDDDDIIEDNKYLEKAVEFVGKEIDGNYIAGVAGYYTDIKGHHYLQEKQNPENLFEKKNKLMNDTYKKLENIEQRLVKTPLVLGGNMVFPKKTIENIPFDPFISRGEDIDYLINAKMEGYQFYFDKALKIVHLPPDYDNDKINITKIESDIYRFIYEKKKLEIAKDKNKHINIETDELKPYPGEFLTANIKKEAYDLLFKSYKKQNISKPKVKAENFIKNASYKAEQLAPSYFNFNNSWKELLSVL